MTLVTQEFCDRAKLRVHNNDQPTALVGIYGNSVTLDVTTKFVLKSRFSDFSIAVEAKVINKIPYNVERGDLSNIINGFAVNYAESLGLPYDGVDILLGNEYVEFVLAECKHFVEGICLRESHFSYVISGSKKRSFFL